jgi:hypothetical protein
MAHDQEVVGSNPATVYWMDVRDDASYYIKRKLKIKVVKWGTLKKYFKKKKKKKNVYVSVERGQLARSGVALHEEDQKVVEDWWRLNLRSGGRQEKVLTQPLASK